MKISQPAPINVGLALPMSEGYSNGETARWTDLEAMARLAEEVGFGAIWVTDHLIVGSGEDARGPWECLSIMAALAAVTKRIEIGSFVINAGFRNPALLSKMAATIDEISGGRLVLGLGAGWHEPEHRAFGYPFDYRVDRFEEALVIIAALLRDGHVKFQGTHYQARDCELRPRGPRPNGTPLMVGAAGPRMLKLAAQFADRWCVPFSQTRNNIENLPRILAAVDAACQEVGREPSSLQRSAAVMVAVGPHAATSWPVAPLTGSAAKLATELNAYAKLGITQIHLLPEPNTLAGVEACAPLLEAVN